MRIERPEDSPLIINDIEDMLSTCIDIYTILLVNKNYHMTSREKEFFIGCVIAWKSNIGIHAKDFNDFMINERKFADSDAMVYTMRNRLKNKRWIQLTPSGYDIPNIFKQDLTKLKINLSIQYKSQNENDEILKSIKENSLHGNKFSVG